MAGHAERATMLDVVGADGERVIQSQLPMRIGPSWATEIDCNRHGIGGLGCWPAADPGDLEALPAPLLLAGSLDA